MIAGALVWANSSYLGLASLFIAQFLLGLGTGTLGVLRSYVVEQTEPDKRTYRLARLSALQYAGFAATPLLGAGVYVIGSSVSSYWKYAFPAYLLVALGTFCQVLLLTTFKDIKREQSLQDDNINEHNIESNSSQNKDKSVHMRSKHSSRPSYLSQDFNLLSEEECDEGCGGNNSETMRQSDIRSNNSQKEVEGRDDSLEDLRKKQRLTEMTNIFLLFITLNFTTRGGIAVYESEVPKILLGYYEVTEITLGALISAAGVIGTMNFLLFKSIWTNHFSDMTLTIGGLILFGLTQLLITDFGAVSYS
jgi:MFS family permease